MRDDIPTRPLYFGVDPDREHPTAGHYLYGDKQRPGSVWRGEFLDGSLAPLDDVPGAAALHFIKGCTVLAWWDRSGDSRGASNSVLIYPGKWTFQEVLDKAAKDWPILMKRQRVAIRPVPQ